ncbi:hypothetical protein QUA23_25075 [Microcoleus sp. Pol1C5]
MGRVDAETSPAPTLKTNSALFRAGDIHPWLFYWHWELAIGDWALGIGY